MHPAAPLGRPPTSPPPPLAAAATAAAMPPQAVSARAARPAAATLTLTHLGGPAGGASPAPAAAAHSAAPAARPMSPPVDLQSAWGTLMSTLESSSAAAMADDSSTPHATGGSTSSGAGGDALGHSRSKLLIARVVRALATAPLTVEAQRVLMFLVSVCESNLEAGEALYMERELTALYPFIHTFLALLARPDAAHPGQYFFSKDLQRCIDTFLLLLQRKAHEPLAIACIQQDMDDILRQLLERHVEFVESVESGEAAFEVGNSPYHTHTLAANAAAAAASGPNSPPPIAGASPSPPVSFQPIELDAWRHLRQLTACRCCQRMQEAEATAREQNPAAAALVPSLPECTCTLRPDATTCSCPFSAAFLLLPAPPRVAAHPLCSFFDLDLRLHGSAIPVSITSAQQLHFLTEKIMTIYSNCIEKQQQEDGSVPPVSAFVDVSARFGTILSYASLPDPALRCLAYQLLSSFLAATPIPSAHHDVFLDFILAALTSRAGRGRRQMARDADAMHTTNNNQLEQQQQLEADEKQLMEADEKLCRVVQAVVRQIPVAQLSGHAVSLIEAATDCMECTSHPPLLEVLTRLCTMLLARFPHTLLTLSQVYLAALKHHQRVSSSVGVSTPSVPVCLEKLLAQLSSTLFQCVSLDTVWTWKLPRLSAVRGVQPLLAQMQQEEKYHDMPQLERQGTDHSTKLESKPRMHTLPSDSTLMSPAKRKKLSPLAASSVSLEIFAAPSTSLSAVTATALAPVTEALIDTLHPIFHDLLRDALPDPTGKDFVHPSRLPPPQAVLMLMQLDQVTRVICAHAQSEAGMLDSESSSSVVGQRLSAHLHSWLSWLNLLASNQQQQLSTSVQAPNAHATYFAVLPTLLHHVYDLLELCARQLPTDFFGANQLSLYHVCAWPLEAEATRKAKATSVANEAPTPISSSYPLSIVAAALRLLCHLPVRDAASECRLMSIALESDQPAVQCMGITLLPAFVARMSTEDRRQRGKFFLQQLCRMCVALSSATPLAPPTLAVANVPAAIADTLGPLICAITAGTSVVNLRNGRTALHELDLVEDAHRTLDEFGRSLAGIPEPRMEEEPSQTPDSPLRALTATQPTCFNQPIISFCAPFSSRLACPHCDGVLPSASALSTSSSILSVTQEVLPFLALLRLSQPLVVRWSMTRSLFRVLRHLPAGELSLAAPQSASANGGLTVSMSPPPRLQSPQQRPRASAHELPFSLSQMGSGKKVRQLPMSPAPARSAAPQGGSGSQMETDSDPPPDGASDPNNPALHPLSLQILLLLFDPSHVVRQCVVEHLEWLIDDATNSSESATGPFFALFSSAPFAGGAVPQVHPCFENFILCLTHIQTNSHMIAAWHQKLQRALQATAKTPRRPVSAIELDLRPVAVTAAPATASWLASLQTLDFFEVDMLLTTFAAIGQLTPFTPLGSATQQLLLWPLIEAMAHAIEHSQVDLQRLALAYFTHLAHAHRLTTNGFFFLHSQYLFEKIFHSQIESTPELLAIIFNNIILQDGVDVDTDSKRTTVTIRADRTYFQARSVDWILRDLYREGVRMTVPSMILHHHPTFCVPGPSALLQQLAKSAAFSDDASMQTFLVSLLDSILSHVFRSPGDFTAGFIQSHLIPFFSAGLKSSVKQLLDFVVFVRSDVLFDLLWRMADERQAVQTKQVMSWIIQGDQDRAKMATPSGRGSSGKMHGYLTLPAAAAPPPLSPAAAAQPFALVAPPATEAQLSDLFLPYFLGVFTRLHNLLTITFAPTTAVRTQPSRATTDPPVQVRVPHTYKVHAVHALGVLMQLSKERLKGFIPKILASMQLFTAASLKEASVSEGSSTSPLAFHLLCLWSIFIETLIASNTIGEYLSTIVVTLVHALGRLSDEQAKQDQANGEGSHAHAAPGANPLLFTMSDFHAYHSSLPSPRVPKPDSRPNLFVSWISSLPESLLEQSLDPNSASAMHSNNPSNNGASSSHLAPPLTAASFRSHCIAHIALILNDLILKARPGRDLTLWFKTIPTLRSYPCLRAVHALLQSDFQGEVERRMKEAAKGLATDVQHAQSSRHPPPPASSRHSKDKEEPRPADAVATYVFNLHLERILSTISHESDQVRNFSLKHFRFLLRDPVHRACWESYCNSEISGLFVTNSAGLFGPPRFTLVVSALLQRCADTNMENKLLASECMGEIGAVDPGHLSGSITVKPPQFTTQDASHHRSVHLAHYLIQHLLVRSLRSAIETQSQDRALCAIQQLLKYCGIDRTVQEVAERNQVVISDKTQLLARNQLEQELTRIIESRHASRYLPHSALPMPQQRSQVYQALTLWLEFPADVRAIIAPCLTSAFLIQDSFLQPRVQSAASQVAPAQPGLGYAKPSGDDPSKKAGSGSARKRKEMNATPAADSNRMDVDDDKAKSRPSTRTTPERKPKSASTAAVPSTRTPPPEDAAPTLTESTIRLLPSKSVYNRKLGMPQWLAEFTRYLIVYTALPIRQVVDAHAAAPGGPTPATAPSAGSSTPVSETLLYQACIGVVQSDVSIALFLLPYLVDHALRYGSDDLIRFIHREILAVLHAHARFESSGAVASSSSSGRSAEVLSQSSSATSAHSSAQMCIQTVFELLDTLQQWCVAERRSIEKSKSSQPLSGSSATSSSAASDRPNTLSLHYGAASPAAVVTLPSVAHPSTRSLTAYKDFIDSIPKKVLANAAFHCKAFTRALKYMESHLREEKDRWRIATERKQAAMAQHVGKSRGRGTMTSALAAAASGSNANPEGMAAAAPLDGMITDGPGAGFLSSDLDSFQHMYASLEEPDGMRGLASLRQKQTVASQIKDLESVGKWAEALTCYDNCLQNEPTQMSYNVGMMDCFRNLGQWQGGLKHAQALLTLQPTHARQVSVYAVQNAWRLRDWQTVEQLLTSKQPPEPTHFEVRLAALLLALNKGDLPLFDAELRRARKAVLLPLTAASWESYERAYPYLLQLQMIAEVDQIKNAMQDTHHRKLGNGGGSGSAVHTQPSLALSGSPTPAGASSYSYSTPASAVSSQSSVKDTLSQLSLTWSTRLRRTTQTFRIREQILCLRRVLYSQFDMQLECGMGWLQLAHHARQTQQFEVAQGALLHATQMAIPNTFIERARLLRARGQLHDALLDLEKSAPPDTKDTSSRAGAMQSSSLVMSQGTIDASFRGAPPVVKACLSATICLVLGKWIQESNAKESRDVITLYNKAIHFQPKWEKAHFLLGQYYDHLLAAESNRSRFGTLHSKQQQQQQNEYDQRGKAPASRSRVNVTGASPDVVSKFLGAILKSYGSSLTHGHKYLFQSMPRILTLWFEHSENHWDGTLTSTTQIPGGGVSMKAIGSTLAKAPGATAPNNLSEKFSQCHLFLCDLTKTLPAYQWLTAFPQIISRLTHKLAPVYAFIKDIITKVFVDYPQQALWLLAPVNKSIDAARSARSREILSAVRKTVPVSTNNLIDRGLLLFDQLIKICTFLPKQKKCDSLQISVTFPQLHQMHHLPLIVPLQQQMTVSLPVLSSDSSTGVGASMDTPINGSMSYDNHYQQLCKTHRAFPSHQCTIAGFGNEIEVLKSKEKPKKLTVLGSDGHSHAFLCKKEIKGDMRKNSRMMEFNTVVNRLLKESGDSRSRHLELRTFSVLPMTEECGLIEWVSNTTGFRHLVRQTHEEHGIQTCFITIKRMYEESGEQVPNDVANEIKLFERLCDLYKPVFHKWFLTQFPEPYAWFQARLKYARSSAVWSMVGYVVGLGDRHGENILIDESTGDCVHVDFDCLFGKGLTLEKPERVPFRLTPNMVDALGICGVDGLFSSSAEVAMQVMRSNEQTMMSVLHTFIYDPLVEWKTVGAGSSSSSSAASLAPSVGVTFHPNAVRILDEIEMKLRGQVAKESLPLNVHGQVAQLIKEAASPTNLAQMYIGWMAWL